VADIKIEKIELVEKEAASSGGQTKAESSCCSSGECGCK
jgi:hypothetical protein